MIALLSLFTEFVPGTHATKKHYALWFTLSNDQREHLVQLVGSDTFLSSSFPSSVLLPAVNLLTKIFTKDAAGSVGRMEKDRLGAVVTDVITQISYPWKNQQNQLIWQLFCLGHRLKWGGFTKRVWETVAVKWAVRDDTQVGKGLRKQSTHGKVPWKIMWEGKRFGGPFLTNPPSRVLTHRMLFPSYRQLADPSQPGHDGQAPLKRRKLDVLAGDNALVHDGTDTLFNGHDTGMENDQGENARNAENQLSHVHDNHPTTTLDIGSFVDVLMVELQTAGTEKLETRLKLTGRIMAIVVDISRAGIEWGDGHQLRILLATLVESTSQIGTLLHETQSQNELKGVMNVALEAGRLRKALREFCKLAWDEGGFENVLKILETSIFHMINFIHGKREMQIDHVKFGKMADIFASYVTAGVTFEYEPEHRRNASDMVRTIRDQVLAAEEEASGKQELCRGQFLLHASRWLSVLAGPESPFCFDRYFKLVQCPTSSDEMSASALRLIAENLCILGQCEPWMDIAKGNFTNVGRSKEAQHGQESDSFPSQECKQQCSNLVYALDSILRMSECDELLSAAVCSIGVLLLVSPQDENDDGIEFLMGIIWHPSCRMASQHAIQLVSALITAEEDALVARSLGRQLCDTDKPQCLQSGNPWDGFDMVTSGEGLARSVLRALEKEVHMRLEQWENAIDKSDIEKLASFDPHPLVLLLALDHHDFVPPRITGRILFVLVAASLIEKKAWRSSLVIKRNRSSTKTSNVVSKEHYRDCKVWKCFLPYVLKFHETSHQPKSSPSESHSLDKSTEQGTTFGVDAKPLLPVGAIVAAYLNFRISKWLPYALHRLLTYQDFAIEVAELLHFPDMAAFWKKAARHTVGKVLMEEDSATLASLGIMLKLTTKELVDRVFADVLAWTALCQGEDLDLGANRRNLFLSECIGSSLEEVLQKRAGKVVQRITMEMGGFLDSRAMSALKGISRVMNHHPTSPKDDLASVGVLVSNHFMLIIDAVNRGLFQSKATRKDRVRFLCMLDRVVQLAGDYLHLYVPKILATLKMATDIESRNSNFRMRVICVWKNFLQSLGAQRTLPHLGSVLAILLPALNEHEDILLPTLRSIIDMSSSQSRANFDEITLLLKITKNPSLKQAEVTRTRMALERRKCDLTDEKRGKLIELLVTNSSVCKIISQHGNGVIEVLAAEFLLDELRRNRDELDRFLSLSSTSSPLECVHFHPAAEILSHLVATLNKTKNVRCQETIMQCIGEIGALDPLIVHGFAQRAVTSAADVAEATLSYSNPVPALVSTLLNEFLVPALEWASQRGGSNNHLNRIGLVIQELLRVCGCRRDTASRAKTRTKIKDPGQGEVDWVTLLQGNSEEENGVIFWENLNTSTRTVAQPYLAEPFDVHHYASVFGGGAAGNLEVAMQPVWSKVKAVTATGATPSSHEWRRQLVVQLVDYIGEEGKFGKTLKALRPLLRYNDNIAAYVFPFIVTAALDNEKKQNRRELEEFLAQEFSMIFKEAVSSQPVFDLFDVLRRWREERSKIRGLLIPKKNAHRFEVGGAKRKALIELNIQKERERDALAPLVDMDGGALPPVSLLHQAKAAFRARSYARTILLCECFMRNRRKSRGNHVWPSIVSTLRGKEGEDDEREAFGLLQKAFGQLEDSDSMDGIAALRGESSLGDIIVEAEAAGRYDEALVTYERVLAKSPRSPEVHEGFMRCLLVLGHWETMLSHAQGLLFSSSREERELKTCSRALGIDAAWRLSRWDVVDKLGRFATDTSKNTGTDSRMKWNLEFNVGLGNMFTLIGDKKADKVSEVASIVRKQLLSPISRLSREGYIRAYPMITLLHILSDVEDAANNGNFDGNPDDHYDDTGSQRKLKPLISLKGREIATSHSLRVKEPILSARRTCFQQFNENYRAALVNLRLAELEHEAGNLRAASAYAFYAQSEPSKKCEIYNDATIRIAQISYAQGETAGALRIVKGEIERLLTLEESCGKRRDSVEGSISDKLCTAYVIAGQWIEEARSEPSDVIADYFMEATLRGPNRVEPFYALGRHFDTILQVEMSASASTDSNSSRRTSSTSSDGDAMKWSLYVPHVIKSFTKALCNGHSRIFEVLPRMLTVWFDYHSAVDSPDVRLSGNPPDDLVNKEIKRAFKSIPIYMWMTVIPQLMSRLLHPRKQVQDDLRNLLAKVFVAFPEQCSWLILPSALLQSPTRRKAAHEILKVAMNGKKSRKRGRLDLRSVEQVEQERVLSTRIATAHKVVQYFIDICVNMLPKEKRGRAEDCSSEFRRLRHILMKSGGTNPIMPTLKALTVQLPTMDGQEHEPFAPNSTSIVDIDDTALVMSSLMRPRRISLVGSDGKRYRFLAKKETAGDMRKDSRLVEFITVVNRLLSKDSTSCHRDLELKTYAVLPLTEEAGMIEWVNDLEPLRKVVRDEQVSVCSLPDAGMVQRKHSECVDKRKFLEWAVDSFPPVLDRFFLHAFGNGAKPEAWLRARNLWTRSVAVWSMAGYIVGLGDRHGENVLIETTTGRCVHVDFAMLFEKGMTLRVPEIVPFRLTPNMIGAMGIAGYEGSFRVVSEVVMGVMRRNSDALLGVLETFLYDPLADWCKSGVGRYEGGVIANREAWQTRMKVGRKLKGLEGGGGGLSIKGQVERLIQEASSMDNLSKMYIWWSGWI